MTQTRQDGAGRRIAFVAAEQIGARARSGAIWSSLQIGLRNVVSIGVTAILARMLAPHDYGLIGMVATLTALLQVFSDMGLNWATVQRRELTVAQVNGLFWVNLTAGCVFWLLMAVAAPGLAAFYGEPALALIAPVSGVVFLIAGVAAQPMALLTRAMDFRRIALIEVASLAAGAGAALALALAGAGYWALVAQGPVQAAARAVLALWTSGLRISAPRRVEGLGAMIRFGGLLTLSGLLIYLARNLDSVLIGRIWGAAELGLYNRAYFLMLLPSMLANGVLLGLMVSSLSAFQGDKARFADAYRRALRLVAYVGTPMALGLALTAGPAVELIYGPGWTAVAPALIWLSLAGITQPIYNTNGWLFTAAGKGRPYLILTVANSLLLGAVFFYAVPKGILAVAQGYGLAMGLIIPLPALWLAHRVAGIPFGPSLRALAPVMLLNLIMGVAVWSTGNAAGMMGLSPMAGFPMQVVAGVAIYLALTPILLPEMLRRDLAPLLSGNSYSKKYNKTKA